MSHFRNLFRDGGDGGKTGPDRFEITPDAHFPPPHTRLLLGVSVYLVSCASMAADAKIGRCNACLASLAISGSCAVAFGPLAGAGAPQRVLIPLAIIWGGAAVAVSVLRSLYPYAVCFGRGARSGFRRAPLEAEPRGLLWGMTGSGVNGASLLSRAATTG